MPQNNREKTLLHSKHTTVLTPRENKALTRTTLMLSDLNRESVKVGIKMNKTDKIILTVKSPPPQTINTDGEILELDK